MSYALLPSYDADGNTSLTHDLRLTKIKNNKTGEFTLGLALGQASKREESTVSDTGGWALNVLHKQALLSGENRLSLQFGEGGLADPGTRNNPLASSADVGYRLSTSLVINALGSWSSMRVLIYEDMEVNQLSIK